MAELETRVALLEREQTGLSSLLGRFDTTIEKLADVSNSIKQLLAVHEVQLKKHDEADNEIYQLLDARRDEIIAQNTVMQNKFNDLHNQVKSDITSVETSLMSEMKDMRNDMHKRHKESEKRTAVLERWRWIAIGVIGAAFMYFSKINIFSFMA